MRCSKIFCSMSAKSMRQNEREMQAENYRLCREKYEQIYGESLT